MSFEITWNTSEDSAPSTICVCLPIFIISLPKTLKTLSNMRGLTILHTRFKWFIPQCLRVLNRRPEPPHPAGFVSAAHTDTVTGNLKAKISFSANSGSVMTWAAAIHLHNNGVTAAPTHTHTHTHTNTTWHHVMAECASWPGHKPTQRVSLPLPHSTLMAQCACTDKGQKEWSHLQGPSVLHANTQKHAVFLFSHTHRSVRSLQWRTAAQQQALLVQ